MEQIDPHVLATARNEAGMAMARALLQPLKPSFYSRRSSMDLKRLQAAIEEAHRFLRSTEKAQLHLRGAHPSWSSQDVAACRRASLDLSRALSELRKR